MADSRITVLSEHRQTWTNFLKTLAAFSGDLSTLTAPSFILSPTSLLEYTSFWGQNPEVLADITDPSTDALERMLKVILLYVSTLPASYSQRNHEGGRLKPLNPILGEVFKGTWSNESSHGKGDTNLVSEQVSHHPPVSAFHVVNAQAGIEVEGYNGQSTHFAKGAVSVRQVGHTLVRATPPGQDTEVYLITLPHLTVEGIWYAKPYVELANTQVRICSSTGYLATLEFSGKGYFSGKRHQLKATVTSIKDPHDILYTIQGDWSAQTFYVGPSPLGEENALFWDATTADQIAVTVKPLSEQAENESRRLWHTTTEAINACNFSLASKSKSRIEQEQREKRKLEEQGKLPLHRHQYFTLVEDDSEYATLAASAGHKSTQENSYRRKASTQE